jgi:hypothetical protein
MQPGGQAHVDEIDRGVVVDRVQVGGRGEPELRGDLPELPGGVAEDVDLIDGGMAVEDASVSDSEAGAQQADLHRAGSSSSGRSSPATIDRSARAATPVRCGFAWKLRGSGRRRCHRLYGAAG